MMRRNDICAYDHRDGGFMHYGRIWKIVDGEYYWISSSGEVEVTKDVTRLLPEPNYKGYWRSRYLGNEEYKYVFVRMPTLKRMKATWKFRYYKDKLCSRNSLA